MITVELPCCTWLDVSEDGTVRVEALKVDQRMNVVLRRACLCGERVRVEADGSAFFGHLAAVSGDSHYRGEQRMRLTLRVAAGSDCRDPADR